YFGPHRAPINIGEFVLRRIVRIMPTYWMGLLLVMLIRAVATPHVHGPLIHFIDWTQPVAFDELARHALLVLGNFNATATDGPIWSLRVEMQASLLLPLFIGALQLRPTKGTIIVVCGITAFM